MNRLSRALAFALSLWMAGPALAAPPAASYPPGLSPTGDGSGVNVTATGGTAARTMAARAADTVNAVDFGLVCDGATDNTTAFGRIYTKLVALGGGTVFFPPASAKCLSSTALQLPSNSIAFAYPGTVTLAPTSGNTSSPLLLGVASVAKVTISGLTFDGGGQDFSSTNNVTQVYNSTDVLFDHVAFQNARGVAALFSQANRSGVRSSSFSNIGNHWKTTLAAGDRQQAVAICCTLTINTSAAQGAAGNTLNFASTTNVFVGQPVTGTSIPLGTTVLSLTSTSVTLSASTTAAVASGTTISFSSVGDFLIDNTFNDIGLDAMSATTATDVSFSGNRCEIANNQVNLLPTSAYSACIYTSGLTGSTIVGNISSGASGNGFDLHSSTNQTVVGNYAYKSGSAGIGWFGGSGAIYGNTAIDNAQWTSATFKGGISLTGASNLTVAANTSSDDQSTPTQSYGLHALPGTYTNVTVDQSNTFAGNSTAQIGGAITDYTYTRNAGNMRSALGVPSGSTPSAYPGATILGTNSSVTQNYCLVAGVGNVCNGFSGTALGQSDTVGAFASFAIGQFSQTGPYALAAQAFGLYTYTTGPGELCTGYGATLGASQSCATVLRGSGATASAIRLTADGAAAGAANVVNLPASSVGSHTLQITIDATDITNPANGYSWTMPLAKLYKTGTAQSTTMLALGTPVTLATNSWAPTVSATADTTNGGLNLTFTPPSGNTDTIHVVARVGSVEVQ